MAATRSNAVIVGLAAALIIPRVEQVTGVKLTPEDVADLLALGLMAFHGAAATFERYFPPPPAQPAPATLPNPTAPAQPAK
jgi:hypothetical protein